MRRTSMLICLLFAASLCGCSTPQAASSTQGSTLVRTASVTDIRDVTVHGEHGAGIGSLVGAVIGGLAGSNIGGGTGRAVAAIGGSVTGGIAGQHAENTMAAKTVTELVVRFDNGDTGTYTIEPDESLHIGDPVKVVTDRDGARVMH